MNISLAHKHREQEHHQAQLLLEIIQDLHLDDPLPNLMPTGSTPAGDEARLRGIPVVGAKGVGGAIPGSRPGANLR